MASFYEGYRMGADIGDKITAGLNKRWDANQKKAIAKAGAKDFSFEEDVTEEMDPAQVQARVQQGEQEAAAVRGAADAMAPAQAPAQFNMTQPAAAAAPAPRVGGLQMPKAGTPYVAPAKPETVLQGDVMGTAVEGAKVTAEQAATEGRKTTKVKVPNPLQKYEQYMAQSEEAANQGNLELQKAYADMAEKSWDDGVAKFGSEILGGVSQGNFKPLQRFADKYYPDALRYENIRKNEDGTISFDQVGDKGARVTQRLAADDFELGLEQKLYTLTDPAMRKQLFMANVAARAEAAKYKRDRGDKLQDKEIDRQIGLEKLNITEGGANARAAATNALGWFKAQSSNAIDAARLKLQTMQAQGKIGSGAMKSVKDWAGLGLAPTQVNQAVRLVAEGNDPNIVFDAVSAGFDPTTVKFAPGVGGYVTAAGGGALRLNAGDLFKDITDAKVAEAAKSSYVASVASALDQQSPGWKEDWVSLSPAIKAAALEAQGVGMDVKEFEQYAGFGAKPKLSKTPVSPAGLVVSPRATPLGTPTKATGYPAGVRGSAP